MRTIFCSDVKHRFPCSDDAQEEFWNHVQTGQITQAVTALTNGARVNAQTQAGYTALHFGAMRDDATTISVLLKHGADPDASCSRRCTPLAEAACNGHEAAARALISGGADLERCDWQGNTPLMKAIRHWGNGDTIEVLMTAGASAHAKNKKGETVLNLLRQTWKGEADKIRGIANAQKTRVKAMLAAFAVESSIFASLNRDCLDAILAAVLTHEFCVIFDVPAVHKFH